MSDSTKTKANFSKTFLTGLYYLLMISIGVFIVAILVIYLQSFTTGSTPASEVALLIAGIAIAFYVAGSIHMPLHELGHLLFGKLTGYKLLSFRIGSFMWIQQADDLKFQRVEFAASDGQCLMVPPERQDEKIPYVLYNLGGIIVNFVVALVAAGLAFLTTGTEWLSIFFILLAAFGLAYVVMNAVPIVAGKKHNDGYNIYTISRVEGGSRAYEIQLKISEQSTRGKRLKKMPVAWFDMPSQKAMSNGLIAGIGIFAYKRKLDLLEIEEADRIMARLLELDGLTAEQRKFIIVDRVYCELVQENRKGILDYYLEKKQSNFMDANKTEPAIIRTIFTYEMLANKDQKLAGNFKRIFEQVTASYPYPQQIEMERDLMAYAKERTVL